MKKKVTIICIVCILLIICCFIADKAFYKEYFVDIKYNEVIKKIEKKESFIILISQTECTHCIAYKPKLKQVANNHKITIYYIDVNLIKDKEEFNKFKTYINFSSTPATVFIVDGEEKTVASRINGDASIEKIEKKLKSNGFIE